MRCYPGLGSCPLPTLALALAFKSTIETRKPPLREYCRDAQTDDGAQFEPNWDLASPSAADYEVDQRVSWSEVKAAILMRGGVGLRGSP